MKNLVPALVRSLTLLSLAVLAPGAAADRVVTEDGRILSPKKAREAGAGYKLTFEHGEITLPDRSQVKAVEIEGDMSEYVPANDDEREKLAQGFVRYKGRWMSKPAFQDILRQEHEESRKRADVMALHSDFARAWTQETKHFVLRSNTSPEILEYYAELLESYYSLMDNRLGIKPGPELRRTKMGVNIYKNRAEFQRLTSVPMGVAGFFHPVDLELHFYHDYQEPAISEWVALHEGTHLLTFLIDPQYVPQIWLNEAVADYFGSAVVGRDKKGKLTIESGRVQTDRVLTVQQAIKDGNAVALEDLFTITKAEFEAFEYSHAWSFVYFLNNKSPKYRKGFESFFKDIYTLKKGIRFNVVNYWNKSGVGKEVPPDEIQRIVLESLGVSDLKALDSEWKAYIAAIPIEAPEARFKRAYRAVFYGEMFVEDGNETQKRMDEALADINAAIDGGIRDARAYRVRSRLHVLKGRSADARKDLEQAIEIDPLQAVYRFELGMSLISNVTVLSTDNMDVQFEEKLKTAAEAPEAKVHLGLAAELDPTNERYREVLTRYLAQ